MASLTTRQAAIRAKDTQSERNETVVKSYRFFLVDGLLPIQEIHGMPEHKGRKRRLCFLSFLDTEKLATLLNHMNTWLDILRRFPAGQIFVHNENSQNRLKNQEIFFICIGYLKNEFGNTYKKLKPLTFT